MSTEFFKIKCLDSSFYLPTSVVRASAYFSRLYGDGPLPEVHYEPYPSAVLSHVLCFMQNPHWVLPQDPNVTSALQHFLLIDGAPGPTVMASPAPAPVSGPTIASVMAALTFEGTPALRTSSTHHHNANLIAGEKFRFVSLPLSQDQLTLSVNGRVVFTVTPPMYASVFNICTDGLVFQDKILALINQASIPGFTLTNTSKTPFDLSFVVERSRAAIFPPYDHRNDSAGRD